MAEVATQLDVNYEVMLEPKTIRRLAWVLPDDASESQVLEVLQASQARPWQIENTLDSLVKALKSEN